MLLLRCLSYRLHLELVAAFDALPCNLTGLTAIFVLQRVIFKVVHVLSVLSSLPDVVASAASEAGNAAGAKKNQLYPHCYDACCQAHSLSQTLLKLAVFLLLLIFDPLRPLCVQPFFPAPFLERDPLHLLAQVQHHIAVCRRMRICLEHVRQQLGILELGVGQQVVLLAFGLGQQRVSIGEFVAAFTADLDVEHLNDALGQRRAIATACAHVP